MKTPTPPKPDREPACRKTGHPAVARRRPSRLSVRFAGVGIAGVGFLALLWFLVRVIPKPSRAAYPCQRVAFPLASSFVLWIASAVGAVIAVRRARWFARNARWGLALGCAVLGFVVALALGVGTPRDSVTAAWTPADPPNTPIGTARGIFPGRVVWVHDPDATDWDGASSYWWSPSNTDQEVVDSMLARAVRSLTGAASVADAWDALFREVKRTRRGLDEGFQMGERVAIKINMNVASSYGANNRPIASPPVVLALLRQLVGEAGVAGSAISVYDGSRVVTDPIFDLCHAEFPEVSFVDNDGLRGRVLVTREPDVPVYYSGPGAGASGSTRLPECVVGAEYLVNLALLRAHSLAGVTLCGKNHFGSVWRPDTTTDGGWKPSNLHGPVSRDLPMGSYSCLVDLIGHEHLGGKTVLFLIDALYAAPNQGSSAPARWQSSPFDNDWTSSLFLSQDGVAIDSVGVDFCRNEPTLTDVRGTGVDNYLHEAAQAQDPPSGIFYDPEGDGTRLSSLGVHEHWNNVTDKQYSRNLGTGDGIELVQPSSAGATFRRGDSNADASLDLADPIRILLYLFLSDAEPDCLVASDADDSGAVEVTDAVYLLRYLFEGSRRPAEPFSACGRDGTPDDLGCQAFPPCEATP